MEIQLLRTGGTLTADNDSIICRFSSPRLILSTSLYNGGYLMADAVFNHRLSIFVNSEADLPGGCMEEYLAIVADQYSLNRKNSSGLLTSARMHCRAYSEITYKEIAVEVVATAGVEQNAMRAGAPASYYENNGSYQTIGGTINLLAFTNSKLPYGAMAKAMLTLTEAKTAALQELAVVSPATLTAATGTGTDGIILVSNPDSSFICTDTGTQSKLGELLCQAAKTAIKQSLARECSIEPGRQGTVAERLKRLGIDDGCDNLATPDSKAKLLLAMSQSIWQEYCWGLLETDDLHHFLAFLAAPTMQPLGKILAAALKQKVLSQERCRTLGGLA